MDAIWKTGGKKGEHVSQTAPINMYLGHASNDEYLENPKEHMGKKVSIYLKWLSSRVSVEGLSTHWYSPSHNEQPKSNEYKGYQNLKTCGMG